MPNANRGAVGFQSSEFEQKYDRPSKSQLKREMTALQKLGEVLVDAPGGRIKVDPKTHHLYKKFRLGRIGLDRQFEIVYESRDLIAPEPFPSFAFPGWECDWTRGGLTKGPPPNIGL